MNKFAICTEAFDLSHLNSTQTILLVFGVVIFMFVLSGGVIAVNALFWKRRKKQITCWLEAQGCRVDKIESVFAPPRSLRLVFLSYTSYEVHFVDSVGARHQATVAIPTWYSPEFIEDKIIG